MTSDRWHRIEAIFQGALERAAVGRAAYLREACDGDQVLRDEVESLLAFEEEGGHVISGAVEGAATLFEADEFEAKEGARIGIYRVVREIGRGGMGTVYLAERDDDEFRKQVAIKLVTRGMDTAELLRRFRQERQILAQLDHPYIARLLDGGSTSDGRPFLVMEYVLGIAITSYCDEQALRTNQRIELFLKVCSAVQYAHQNLIVHRDLKPGNILVDSQGIPKLLDFGIAKLLGPNDSAELTRGMQMLTPEYASPEQVRGAIITTAADVYVLGVILYELAAGVHPHRFQSLTVAEMARVICEEQPQKPSTASRRSTVDRDAVPAPRLKPGELDNIVLMAMQKEPSRRYGSVAEFADDLHRYLDGLPVRARQDTLTYRSQKFILRHRTGVAAAVLVVASLAAGLGFSLAAQRRAEKRFDDVRSLANAFIFEIHDDISKLTGATTVRAKVLRKALVYLDGLAVDSAGNPSLQMELARAYIKVGQLQGSKLGEASNSLASFRKAVGIARTLSSAAPANVRRAQLLVEALYGLAQQEYLQGKPQPARTHVTEGRSIVDRMDANRPDTVHLAIRGCFIQAGLERYEGESVRAVPEMRRADALAARLRENSPGDETVAQIVQIKVRLSIVLEEAGDLVASHASLDEAFALVSGLVARNPGNPDYRAQFSRAKWTRSVLAGDPRYVSDGDYPTALTLFREAEGVARQLADADKDDRKAQADYIFVRASVAVVLAELSPAQGLPMLQEAIHYSEALPPEVLELIVAHYSPAEMYRRAALAAARLHQWNLTRSYASRALALQNEWVARTPSFENRLDTAATLREMASIDGAAGNWKLAEQRYREALKDVSSLAEGHQREIQWVWRSTEVLEGLGDVLKRSDRAAACGLYRTSLDQWTQWKSTGGADRGFFRTRWDRAAKFVASCEAR